MAGFRQIVARLRIEERKVQHQLNGIRKAIESLEFGSSVSPAIGPAVSRTKRKFSAATRRKMALAQKARWARRKLKA